MVLSLEYSISRDVSWLSMPVHETTYQVTTPCPHGFYHMNVIRQDAHVWQDRDLT